MSAHGTALVLAALLSSGAAHAQSLTVVPDVRAYALLESSGTDFAGNVVATDQAMTWVEGATKVLPPATDVLAASANGQTLFGSLGEGVGRWTSATGWVPLPLPAGAGLSGMYLGDAADDGLSACGSTTFTDGVATYQTACLWTQAGGSQLLVDPGMRSVARCMSGDGSLIGGYQWPAGSTGQAVVWDGQGGSALLFPPGSAGHGLHSELSAFSSDGRWGAGYVGSDAFLWENGKDPLILPAPPGSTSVSHSIHGVADDGSWVTGYGLFDYESWIWTADQGTRYVADLVRQLMLDDEAAASSWRVFDARGDGSALAGIRVTPPTPPFTIEAFVLELPAHGIGTVVDLGQGLAGHHLPELEAFGSFHVGTPARLALSSAEEQTGSTLVVGLTQLAAPFKGGVMVPDTDLLVPIPTDADGAWTFDFDWPAGIPAGTPLFVQTWVKDSGAPASFAASNALELVTP